jgi:hypothetical protein
VAVRVGEPDVAGAKRRSRRSAFSWPNTARPTSRNFFPSALSETSTVRVEPNAGTPSRTAASLAGAPRSTVTHLGSLGSSPVAKQWRASPSQDPSVRPPAPQPWRFSSLDS